MFDVGLLFVQCLEIFGEQEENWNFCEIFIKVCLDVEQGLLFVDVMGKYLKVFDNFYVNMIVVGEVGGIFDVIFQCFLVYIEKVVKLKVQICLVLMYFVLIIVIVVSVVFIIFWKVILVFVQFFVGFGGELFFLMCIVVGVLNFIGCYIIVIILGFVIIGMVICRYYKIYRG